MIVGIDARHLTGGRGVAHYTSGLLGALAAAHPEDTWRAFVPGQAPLRVPPGVDAVRHRLPSRPLFGAAALAGRPRLDALAGGADVVWLPAPAPVAVTPGVPYVLTVHDLSWLARPGDFTPYERLWHGAGRLARLARRAAAVAVDTAAVGEEVVARWRISPSRIHVIAPGVPAPVAGPPPEGLPSRYLLFVGALEPRKAPDVLARAFARARAEGLDADLVVCGDGRLEHFVLGGGVHRREGPLGPLYEHALALVMPSLLEGFGFPPLEAALAGTPSVVSDLPVFRETLGDAALRVPPGDEGALASALLRIAGDPGLRARLAAAAAERARAFRWDRAAAAMHALLARAAA